MNKFAGNIMWRLVQQYGLYAMKLLVQIALARILVPEEYGIIAIVTAFISVAEIIAISGLGTALVQKKTPDKEDYSTIFSASMLLSVLLYAVLFVSAPIVSKFYGNSSITLLLRVHSLVVFSQSYLAVVNAYVQKQFEFKKSCLGNLLAIIIAGVIAILAAYRGAGVWSLVIYSMLASICAVIIVQSFVSWHPGIKFEIKRFRILFSFSWKVLISTLIGTLLENIYNLTIGKFYGDTTLGYYKQGNTYPDAILGQTRTAIGAVIFPIFASLQDDRKALCASIKKMTHLSAVVIFPLAFGLIAVAKPFVSVVLSDKWLPAVYFLRLECIFYGTLSITTSLNYGLMAIGRSDVAMKIEVFKLLATITVVLCLNNYGVEIICIARVLVAVAFILVSSIIIHNIVGIKYMDLISCVIKPLIISVVMGITTYLISLIQIPNFILLVLQLIVGFGVYALGGIIFMKDDMQYIKNFIKKEAYNL